MDWIHVSHDSFEFRDEHSGSMKVENLLTR
jgi:hypothetical protein